MPAAVLAFLADWYTLLQWVPGQLIIYHAWEIHQFVDGKGFQNLIPSPLNQIDLAGGEGHLRPYLINQQPAQNDRDDHPPAALIVGAAGRSWSAAAQGRRVSFGRP